MCRYQSFSFEKTLHATITLIRYLLLSADEKSVARERSLCAPRAAASEDIET